MQEFFSNGFTNTQKHQQQKTDALANPFCNPRGDVEQQNLLKTSELGAKLAKTVRIQRESGAGGKVCILFGTVPAYGSAYGFLPGLPNHPDLKPT